MPPLTSAGRREDSRCRNNPSATDGLIGMKFELNNLRGLFRRRHKLPFLYGVLASLDQQRMSADDARALNTSVRRDDHFNLDLARDIHSPGEFRIYRRGLDLDLALGFICRTGLGKSGSARKMSAALVTTAHFLHRLILIDTT